MERCGREIEGDGEERWEGDVEHGGGEGDGGGGEEVEGGGCGR